MATRRQAVLAEQELHTQLGGKPWFQGTKIVGMGGDHSVQVLADLAANLQAQGILKDGDIESFVDDVQTEVPSQVRDVPVSVAPLPTPELPRKPEDPDRAEPRREVRVTTVMDSDLPRRDRPTEVEEGSKHRHRRSAMRYEKIAARARGKGYLIAAQEAERRAEYHRLRSREGLFCRLQLFWQQGDGFIVIEV